MRNILSICILLWTGCAVAGLDDELPQDAPSQLCASMKKYQKTWPHTWLALQELAQGSRRDFEESVVGFHQLDKADRFELELFVWEIWEMIDLKSKRVTSNHPSVIAARSAWRHAVGALLMPGRDDEGRQQVYDHARVLITKILKGSIKLKKDVYGL